MNALLDRFAERVGEAMRGPTPASNPLSTPLPEQRILSSDAIVANLPYSFTLGPGFLFRPRWPDEAWPLRSFQLELSGTITAASEVLVPATDSLELTLSLLHNLTAIWSSNLALRLLPVPGETGTVFSFNTGVFVDLQNPLIYDGASELAFQVSGIGPELTPKEE